MDIRRMMIGTAAAEVCAATAAVAQGQPAPAPGPVTAAPAGGGVTLAQYLQRGEARMMAADTDGDGKVSRAEFLAAPSGHGDPAARFARLDANGDGVIDRQEADAALTQRFQRMDTDHDGILSPQERAATHGHRQGRPNEAPGEDDAPGVAPH